MFISYADYASFNFFVTMPAYICAYRQLRLLIEFGNGEIEKWKWGSSIEKVIIPCIYSARSYFL